MKNMEEFFNREILISFDAFDLFENESINWKYCMENATFTHRDACEFVLYLSQDDDIFEDTLTEMKEFGCTEEFMKTVKQARNYQDDIEWLLLYA